MKWICIIPHFLLAGGTFLIFFQELRAGKSQVLILLAAFYILVIGIGLWQRQGWVRWLLIPLVIIITLLTFFMVAGNIAWPERTINTIIVIYGVFMLVEVITFITASKFKSQV